MVSKKNLLLSSVEISFYSFPVSFVIGSLIVNLNLIIFITIGFVYLILNKIKIKLNFVNLSLLLFFLVIILSSYRNLNEIGTENFIKSILLLKFYLLYIVLETLFKNTSFSVRYFFYICFYLIIFLSLDLSLQYFYGKNIFGLVPHEGRIAGVFGHEAIAGAFLQKIFLFSLIGMIFILDPKMKSKSIIITGILAIILFGSFVASNRISFVILVLLFLFLIISVKIFKRNFIYAIIMFLPVFYYLYLNDPRINNKYNGFFYKAKKSIIVFNNAFSNIDEKVIKDKKPLDELNVSLGPPGHGNIFLTSIESFKDKKVLGNGYKSFRIRCSVFVKQNKNYLCSTHPHNYHLEVLHDTGIFGFFILSIFIFSILKRLVKKFFKLNSNYYEKIILALLILNLLIEIFPLKSTGGLFTTWNGTLVWITVALLNYGKNEIKIK